MNKAKRLLELFDAEYATCPKCGGTAIKVTGLCTSGDCLWGCTNPNCLNQFRDKDKKESLSYWTCPECNFEGNADREQVLDTMCTCPKCGACMKEDE